MKKIILILSIGLVMNYVGAYTDYAGKNRPVLELTKSLKKNNKIKITQDSNYLYNDVYNITLPSDFYLPAYSASDCEPVSEKLNADLAKCEQKYPDTSDPNRDKCRNKVEKKYPKKCLLDQSFDLYVNVLTTQGKTKRYKKNPDTAPLASIDLIAYDREGAISPNNASYPKTNTAIMGAGKGSFWDVALRRDRRNYYCIWAKVKLPTKTSHMDHVSELLADFQKQFSNENIVTYGDFTSTWNYGEWVITLGNATSPRRLLLEKEIKECILDFTARTKDYYITADNIISQCTLPIGSKLRRQFVREDFMASKGVVFVGYNRKYFKDDKVAPIYLRVVREGNLACRTNPWMDPRGSRSHLRDFPLITNLPQ